MINLDDFENKLQKAESPPVKPPRITGGHGGKADAEVAEKCLDYLSSSRADGYQDWVEVGMALHDAGCTCDVWDLWSQQSDKYQEGECVRKWKSFGKRNGSGITIASLIQWAAHDSGMSNTDLLKKMNPLADHRQHIKTTAHSTKDDEWPDPIPLDNPMLPDFPTEAMPQGMRDYTVAVAESLEVPADLPATTALGVLGCAAGGRYVVSPTPDWREPVNLYTLSVAPPGSRKSAVDSEIQQPLREIEKFERKEAEASVIENQSKRRLLERKQKALEETVAKGGKEQRSDLDRVNKEIAAFEDVYMPSLITTDSTPEKLADLMSRNEGSIGLFSSEGGAFNVMTGLYSNGTPNLDVYLKAWSGDYLKVDRMSRETIILERPALSVCLSIQPEILAEVRKKRVLDGSGLLARFMFTMPQRWPTPSSTTKTVPDKYRQQWIDCIDSIRHASHSTLILDDRASKAFFNFRLDIHQRSQDWGDLEVIRPWAAKLAGQTLRIAALLHLADPQHRFSNTIEASVIENAVCIAEYFTHHAKAAFSRIGCDPDLILADRISRWTKRHNINRFSRGTLFDAMRSTAIRKATQFDGSLEVLIDHGHIRPAPDTKEGPGRKAQDYDVNPILIS